MIGDNLIVPTTNVDLQETYFNKMVQTLKSSPSLKTKVKEVLNNSGSGVYFNPSWNKRLALDELGEVIAKSAFNTQGTGIAWQKLQQAKVDRSDAISRLKKDKPLNKDVTNENLVNDAISSGKPLKTSGISGIKDTQINELIKSAINNINEWVIYQTIGDAYYNEIQRRDGIQKEVDRELLKGDLKKLKALRSTIKFEDLIDKIDEEIKTIEQAQKAAEEKQKAIDEANKKLSGATTPEQKASAQAELDALLRAGSDGAGAIAKGTGLPKGAIYIGIGLVVAIGAYFMFRKKD
jgi:hypothetical protein